jgi:two-component system, cell cycle response regulator
VTDDFFDTTVEISLDPSLVRSLRHAAGEQAVLVVITGARLGQRSTLGAAPVVVGRGSASDFQLDVDSVSRQHARIEQRDDGSHYVSDLGSTNGTYVNDQRVVAPVPLRDGDRLGIGKCTLKYLLSRNVEAAYHEELQRLAHYDGLTGVLNKAAFETRYVEAFARSRSQSALFSVVLFDLDHFKRVNDTHGHPAGDAVLRQTAELARRVAGQHPLARVGGEEFAVVLEGEGLRAARALGEELRQAVRGQPCRFGDLSIPLTLSVGVAERIAGETGEQLYERADQRLYESKTSGRDRVSG